MARRRLVDPNTWHSGHFKRLRFQQRLLWLGIITLADDEGKLKGEPAFIRAAIFPFDAISLKKIEQDLAQIQQEGLIERYALGGDLYIRIIKWNTYQKPSHPTPSKIPDPIPNSGTPPEMLQNSSGNPPVQVRLGKNSEGEVSKGGVEERSASLASALGGAKASLTSNEDETSKPRNWKEETFRSIGLSTGGQNSGKRAPR